MLTGKQLCEWWSAAYVTAGAVHGMGIGVAAWEDNSNEGRAAWDSTAKWVMEFPKHKANCPYRHGQMECTC